VALKMLKDSSWALSAECQSVRSGINTREYCGTKNVFVDFHESILERRGIAARKIDQKMTECMIRPAAEHELSGYVLYSMPAADR
jgi:hypothetical protein